MIRRTSRIIGLAAATVAVLASGTALANPEVGGSFSPPDNTNVPITSTSPGAPTIVRTVSIKCPDVGTLLANAEAQFGLAINSPVGTPGALQYGISRNASFDLFFSNNIQVPGLNSNPNSGETVAIPGSIQRFDQCAKGQKVTYNFYAFQQANLHQASAFHSRMSVIFLRDRD